MNVPSAIDAVYVRRTTLVAHSHESTRLGLAHHGLQ